MEARQKELDHLHKKLKGLKKSPLYSFRISNNSQFVLGEGSTKAKIMFVGEAPGANEAKTGKPFCGRSGKFLDEMLASVKLKRSDIYITNLVNDRPPENRDPNDTEIKLYSQFLDAQIEIIKPSVIVPLGRIPMKYIFEKFGLQEKFDVIGNIHGKVFEAKCKNRKIKIIPLYHPAVALYNGSMKKVLLKDFEKII